MPKHYGPLFRTLHSCTDQAITVELEKMELTSAQGHIMGYLACSSKPPCPRDIEEAFRLSHPTVSGLLSRMEKKGFIELRMDPDDRRCKRVYVLPKGEECLETMHRTIRDIEEQLVQGFSPQEEQQFSQYLERAVANMGHPGCCHFQKEEDNT